MPEIEHVLCITKNKLPDSWTQPKSVLPMDIDTFEHTCSAAGFQFVPRPEAEKNTSLKQVIPYIILQTKDCSQTAVYSRTGSEKRLHDLKSIGIGGHINPDDQNQKRPDFLKVLSQGMQRELDEELIQRTDNEHPEFIGIISEDISDVGKVHIGAIFRLLTDTPDAFVPGEELTDFTWVKTETLNEFDLELWSELTLELISQT